MPSTKNPHAQHFADRQCTGAVAELQRDNKLGLQGHVRREINARGIMSLYAGIFFDPLVYWKVSCAR